MKIIKAKTKFSNLKMKYKKINVIKIKFLLETSFITKGVKIFCNEIQPFICKTRVINRWHCRQEGRKTTGQKHEKRKSKGKINQIRLERRGSCSDNLTNIDTDCIHSRERRVIWYTNTNEGREKNKGGIYNTENHTRNQTLK